MRTKLLLTVLFVSAVATVGLFLPAATYAGQTSTSQLILASTLAESAPPTVALTAREHVGGSMRGGRAWRGGGIHERSFHRGYRVQPYGYTYVEPYCDKVWDRDLRRWVCTDDSYSY